MMLSDLKVFGNEANAQTAQRKQINRANRSPSDGEGAIGTPTIVSRSAVRSPYRH
jgi:hypothetical protein